MHYRGEVIRKPHGGHSVKGLRYTYVSTVVHYGGEVIRNPHGGHGVKGLHLKVTQGATEDVPGQDQDKIIPVCSDMFMVESQGMSYLMDGNPNL